MIEYWRAKSDCPHSKIYQAHEIIAYVRFVFANEPIHGCAGLSSGSNKP